MTTRQAKAALFAYEALMERRQDQQREDAWLQRAAAGNNVVPVRVMTDADVAVSQGDALDA